MGVSVGVGVGVSVFVGVGVFVGVSVFVGVGVFVGVSVGVGVFVGVILAVGVGDDSINSNSKSHGSITSVQFKHQKSNRLNLFFKILKLCWICGADKGSTYIRNCEIAPSKVPAKFGSINMSVDKPDKLVPDNVELGINSGSWM